MTFDPNRRPPIVTDADRAWAMAQRPAHWQDNPEPADIDADAVDDLDPDGLPIVCERPAQRPLRWADFVDEQIRHFERCWDMSRKSALEWSIIFRSEWWPKADPTIRHPKTAPHVPHPVIRSDHPAWSSVLAALAPHERRIAERFGVMSFRPNDPRVARLGDVFTVIHKHPRRAA